MKYNVNFKVMT